METDRSSYTPKQPSEPKVHHSMDCESRSGQAWPSQPLGSPRGGRKVRRCGRAYLTSASVGTELSQLERSPRVFGGKGSAIERAITLRRFGSPGRARTCNPSVNRCGEQLFDGARWLTMSFIFLANADGFRPRLSSPITMISNLGGAQNWAQRSFGAGDFLATRS